MRLSRTGAAALGVLVGLPASVFDPLLQGGTQTQSVLDEQFGADPTAVIDSSSAFQAAFNAGVTPYVPPGTYLVNTAPTARVNQRIIIPPGVSFIGQGAAALSALGNLGLEVCPIAQPNVMALGTSTTSGSNGIYTGLVGGWVSYFVEQLRQYRGDFEMVASQAMLPESSAGSSVVWNEGHPGFTIAQLTTNLATYIASSGTPDVFIVMAGENDITGGHTLAQMQSDWSALYAAMIAANPNALIIAMAPAPFVAGTTVGANLATWNALQAQFEAWLRTTWAPANASNVVYSTASQALTPGDRLVDGVHQTQQGEGALGAAVATLVDQVLGYRRAAPELKSFRFRQPWASEQCITSSTDGLTCTGHSGFNPGSGSFTIAFDYTPTALPAGTASLISYGAYAVNNYFGILQVGNAIRVYWMNTTATIATSTGVTFSESALVVGRRHRIMVQADAVHGVVGLYVNAKLAGLATGVGAWTSTQQTLYVGKDLSFGAGALGFYGRIWAAKAVPGKPGGVQALRAAEADYFLGASPIEGQATASFTLNGSLADDVYAPGNPNPLMVPVGGMAAVGAWPGGTPLAPWESDGRSIPSALYDVTGAAALQVGNGLVMATSSGVSAASSFTLSAAQQRTPIIQLTGTVAAGGSTITVPNTPGWSCTFDLSAVTLTGNLTFAAGSGTTVVASADLGTHKRLVEVVVSATNVVSWG